MCIRHRTTAFGLLATFGRICAVLGNTVFGQVSACRRWWGGVVMGMITGDGQCTEHPGSPTHFRPLSPAVQRRQQRHPAAAHGGLAGGWRSALLLSPRDQKLSYPLIDYVQAIARGCYTNAMNDLSLFSLFLLPGLWARGGWFKLLQPPQLTRDKFSTELSSPIPDLCSRARMRQ